MIEIKNLSFQYASGKSVLENINLEIREGEVVSIIGKNGAGKSTFLRLIAGLMKPTSGEVLLNEMNVQDKKKRREIRRKLGIVFQNPENQILFPRVYEEIEFALKNLDLPNRDSCICQALEQVGMEPYLEADTYELSLGQKQRINIASVLAVHPNYILFDEPTTMIDSQGKEKIYKIIRNLKKQGYTILYVTNHMDEILLSDRVLVLEGGKIETIFNKKDIFENIVLLKESDIKIPEIINILLQLKEKQIDINLTEWTMEEMAKVIVKACEK